MEHVERLFHLNKFYSQSASFATRFGGGDGGTGKSSVLFVPVGIGLISALWVHPALISD